ncbi:UNVERIFIED_CONTAM: hypothetical protein FKN15_024939 [Acipenser sinensis]
MPRKKRFSGADTDNQALPAAELTGIVAANEAEIENGEEPFTLVAKKKKSTEPPLGAAGRGSSESEIPGGGGSLPAVTVDQGLGTGGRDGPGSQSGSVLAPGSGTEQDPYLAGKE